MHNSELINDEKSIDILKELFSILNIKFSELDELVNIELERNDILKQEVSDYFQKYQSNLKSLGYKTGNLTSLHKNNTIKQKWPGINMLRQILKCNQLQLKPFVKSNGYDKSTGKKNTVRYYIIKKLQII